MSSTLILLAILRNTETAFVSLEGMELQISTITSVLDCSSVIYNNKY
jgi:hypothetical protein